jgi:hypothetical protein
MSMDRRRHVVLGSAALAVVLTVAGCASSNHTGSTAGVSSPTPSASTEMTASPPAQPSSLSSTASPTAAASTDDQRAHLASAVVAQLIVTFAQVLPPDAQPIAQGPIRDTDLPREAGPINIVQSSHWYAVPQPQDAALAYVAARMPAGFTKYGGESANGPIAYVDNAYAGEQTETYDTPIVNVLATSELGQTKVWIYAYTTWRPVRTPAEFVAPGVSGATAVSAPGGDYLGATLHVDQTRAQHLAQLIDALDTRRPSAAPCIPGSMYTVTFDGTGQAFDVDGCAEVTVRTGATQQPALADDAPIGQRSILDTELDTIFGREVGCTSADIPAPSCSGTFSSSAA